MAPNTIRLSLSAIIVLLILFICIAGLAGYAGSTLFSKTIPVQSNSNGTVIPISQQVTVSPSKLAADIAEAHGKSIFTLAEQTSADLTTLGTGIALTNDGIIMTILDSPQATMVAIGEEGIVFPLTLIGGDTLSGITFYKADNKSLTPITLSQSTLRIGSALLALYRQSNTSQITAQPVTFSATLLPSTTTAPGIQKLAYTVDTERIPGGAALLDENGNLAGVLLDPEKHQTMFVSDIRSALERLSSNQLTQNPYQPLGFNLNYAAKIQANNSMQIKSIVSSITKNSPADTADLQEGDVLTAISGNAISWDTNIVNALNAKPLILTVVRKGTEQQITINP